MSSRHRTGTPSHFILLRVRHSQPLTCALLPRLCAHVAACARLLQQPRAHVLQVRRDRGEDVMMRACMVAREWLTGPQVGSGRHRAGRAYRGHDLDDFLGDARPRPGAMCPCGKCSVSIINEMRFARGPRRPRQKFPYWAVLGHTWRTLAALARRLPCASLSSHAGRRRGRARARTRPTRCCGAWTVPRSRNE